MSDPQPQPLDPDELAGDTEEVDALVVEPGEGAIAARAAAAAPVASSSRALSPAVQAAAVAAGGFVAGAAVVGLVSRRHARALEKAAARPRLLARRRGARSARGAELLQVVGTRSLLVDVHLLGAPESR